MDDLAFDAVTAGDAERLLELARAFHAEDGHPLDSRGEAAIARLPGEPMARCWLIRQNGATIGYVVLTLGYSIEYGADATGSSMISIWFRKPAGGAWARRS